MERNSEKITRQYLFIASVMVMIIVPVASPSYGDEDRKVRYGFSIFGGMGDAFHDTPSMAVYRVLPRISLSLYKNWDLEFEGNFSYYDIHKKHDLYFLGLNSNIPFKPIQEKWGSLFLVAGGGLGYDSAGKRLKPDDSYLVGDQHLGGIPQGGAGILFNIGRGTALRVEYRLYHISEPFRTDRGLNTHNLLLGISFWTELLQTTENSWPSLHSSLISKVNKNLRLFLETVH